MSTQRDGLPRRVKAAEEALDITPNDRIPLHRRLAALETAVAIITDIDQVRKSLDNRINEIEEAI